MYPVFFLLLFDGCEKDVSNDATTPGPDVTDTVDETSFTNPIMDKGADSWVTQQNGIYYYTYTQGSKLVLYPTKSLAELQKAAPVNALVPPAGTNVFEEPVGSRTL